MRKFVWFVTLKRLTLLSFLVNICVFVWNVQNYWETKQDNVLFAEEVIIFIIQDIESFMKLETLSDVKWSFFHLFQCFIPKGSIFLPGIYKLLFISSKILSCLLFFFYLLFFSFFDLLFFYFFYFFFKCFFFLSFFFSKRII